VGSDATSRELDELFHVFERSSKPWVISLLLEVPTAAETRRAQTAAAAIGALAPRSRPLRIRLETRPLGTACELLLRQAEEILTGGKAESRDVLFLTAPLENGGSRYVLSCRHATSDARGLLAVYRAMALVDGGEHGEEALSAIIEPITLRTLSAARRGVADHRSAKSSHRLWPLPTSDYGLSLTSRPRDMKLRPVDWVLESLISALSLPDDDIGTINVMVPVDLRLVSEPIAGVANHSIASVGCLRYGHGIDGTQEARRFRRVTLNDGARSIYLNKLRRWCAVLKVTPWIRAAVEALPQANREGVLVSSLGDLDELLRLGQSPWAPSRAFFLPPLRHDRCVAIGICSANNNLGVSVVARLQDPWVARLRDTLTQL